MMPFQSWSTRTVRKQFSSALSVTATVLWVIAAAQPARAETPLEVQRLAASGQVAAALRKADDTLATKPKDAQMRFVKGVILADSGRRSEAIELFRGLTEDYPDLPEPYNNLAALSAASGDYDSSRLALEQALRANPSYAVAHENLGDVYAMLAARAYEEAQKLQPANTNLPRKLALVRQLVTPHTAATLPTAQTVSGVSPR